MRGYWKRAGRRRGSAAVEVGLLLPWIVFSFMAVMDFGFACYGLISTQNAARAGAMWGSVNTANAQSAGFATRACTYALDALRYAPNVGASVVTCGAAPVTVSAQYLASGADTRPAVSVAVTYTVTLLRVPGMMPGSLAITRTVQLPVRN